MTTFMVLTKFDEGLQAPPISEWDAGYQMIDVESEARAIEIAAPPIPRRSATRPNAASGVDEAAAQWTVDDPPSGSCRPRFGGRN